MNYGLLLHSLSLIIDELHAKKKQLAALQFILYPVYPHILRSDTHSYPGNLEQTVHQVLELEKRKENKVSLSISLYTIMQTLNSQYAYNDLNSRLLV